MTHNNESTNYKEHDSDKLETDGYNRLHHAYWRVCRAIVEDLVTRSKSGELSSMEEIQSDLDTTCEWHQWVIYPHQSRILLLCASKPDSYMDETGEPCPIDKDTGNPDLVLLAGYALKHDCNEHLQAFAKELEDIFSSRGNK